MGERQATDEFRRRHARLGWKHTVAPAVQPEDFGRSAGGPEEPEQYADGRRLARPIGSEKSEQRAFDDGKRDALDATPVAISAGEVFEMDQRHGSRRGRTIAQAEVSSNAYCAPDSDRRPNRLLHGKNCMFRKGTSRERRVRAKLESTTSATTTFAQIVDHGFGSESVGWNATKWLGVSRSLANSIHNCTVLYVYQRRHNHLRPFPGARRG